MPGDKIRIQNGLVYLNGKRLPEEYLPPGLRTEARGFAAEGDDITVSPNNYYVLGDNRPFSSDSREWGLVTFDKVIGKSALVYWPVNKIRFVEHAEY